MYDSLLVKYVRSGNYIVGVNVVEAGQTVLVSADLIHLLDTPWIHVDPVVGILKIIDMNSKTYTYHFELFDQDNNLYILNRIDDPLLTDLT